MNQNPKEVYSLEVNLDLVVASLEETGKRFNLIKKTQTDQYGDTPPVILRIKSDPIVVDQFADVMERAKELIDRKRDYDSTNFYTAYNAINEGHIIPTLQPGYPKR